MKIKIEINPQINRNDWDNYVTGHPFGNVYHSKFWQEILQTSFGYKPYYLFAFKNNHQICGLLPICYVKSFLTKNRLISIPKSHICDILADSSEIKGLLIKRAKKLYRQFGADYLEIRSDKIGEKLPKFEGYATYILKLSEDVEEVWQRLDRVCVRKAIKKAKRSQVEIIEKNSQRGLKIFDQLNQVHKKNLGTPAQPIEFLKTIMQKMPANFHLYLAKFQNKYIGGLINLDFKDTVISLYIASDKKYLIYRPNNLLYWQGIEDSCKKGFKYFDFGRTLKSKKNLTDFKKRWGTEQKQLYYYYYPSVPTTLTTDRMKPKFRILSAIWRKMPITISQPLSNFLYKHFD